MPSSRYVISSSEYYFLNAFARYQKDNDALPNEGATIYFIFFSCTFPATSFRLGETNFSRRIDGMCELFLSVHFQGKQLTAQLSPNKKPRIIPTASCREMKSRHAEGGKKIPVAKLLHSFRE